MSVVAARSMAAGEVVLSVPASLHVTSHRTAADVEPFDKDKVGHDPRGGSQTRK